ncbi:AI-2E family transporter [Phaeobacter sp. B1627]|uniref:AI-2E family transporter n=1 Tax=Phaeobacter sp. B1627 TaxID=2583809 RepID=UPI0011184651|nr:AI-2E family transporter [Phaeobacter sp. B1627]TNJ40628.1 AI-2E family transporter [Phaeobacter sp. B1627]
MRIEKATHALALCIMVVWLLWIGQTIMLPLVYAIIALYLIFGVTTALCRIPFLDRIPKTLLRLLVLLAITVGFLVLFIFIGSSVARVVDALPGYERNFDVLIGKIAHTFGFDGTPSWERVRDSTIGQIDVFVILMPFLNGLKDLGVTLFLVSIYAVFVFAERIHFSEKLERAIGDAGKARKIMSLLDRINDRVGQYLLVKTLINLILGTLSFVVMYVIGIEFALFWAVLIGVLNYIPYIGSWIAVVFPVLLSLVQSASIELALITLVSLITVQVYIGNFLEPRLMGRAFNLSPLVVLVSLAFWGALWNIAGAVLAIPFTVSLMIVLAELPATRPIVIMLSARGQI